MDIAAIQLIRQLQRLDTQNEYFVFCINGPDNALIHETSNFSIVNIPEVSYPIAEQIILPYMALKYNLDLLHSTGNTAPLLAPCKQLITLHDIIFLQQKVSLRAGAALHQKLGSIYRKLIVPAGLKKAEKIITVSESEKKNILAAKPALSEKLEVIYNAAGAHFKVKPASTLLNTAARYNLYGEPYLFMQGNTDPKKNVLQVLAALDVLLKKGKLHFRLVLSDLTEFRLDSLLQKYKLQHLRPKIQLTGYINNTELPDVYNMATAFIYPSTHESFGIPVLEAMACGTPVITSNCSALPEIAGDAALLVDPQDTLSVATGIERMMYNEELRNEFTLRGLERCRSFSWYNSSEQLLRHYQEVLHLPLKHGLEV